jgi:RimJ/RimL family protein N-acetyltransferase
VRLRPLLDDDLPALYLASLDPQAANTWRYRGRTVPVDEFLRGLHDGVRAQYVVELVESGTPVGLVIAYDHQQAGRHCKVAFIRFGPRTPGDRGAVLEGLIALMSHLFASHPYRKLYIELPGYNRHLLEPEIFEVEGTLREHLFHDGRYVDLHIASLPRARWEELRLATGW